MVQRKWNAEIVVSALNDLHERGSRANSSYVQRNHAALYSAGVRYFGTWKATLEAAKLSHVVPQRNAWSKEIIITLSRTIRSCIQSLANTSVAGKQLLRQ